MNDSKKRVDHETGELPKNFLEDVLEANDDDTALQIIIAEEDEHYEEIKSVRLQEFDIMSSSAIKKKVNQLLKVRKQLQKNMTISGEHDSNPYNFVEVAMNSIGKNGLSLLGCYYFFKRCEDNPEVDVCFSQEMDDALKGNTDYALPSDASSKGEKKRAYAAMVDISNVAKSIAAEMKETNRLAQEAANLAKQSQLIAVAQHLGKNDILETILASFSSASDD